MRRYPVAALVNILLSSVAVSQFTERIDVRVHELEVVVETRDGKPVTDLRQDDFIVLQDGVVQTITNFSIVNLTTATASANGDAPAPQAPPAAAAARDPRKFIFYLDDFGMLDATRQDLLRQSGELVGVMREGDEAMVVTPAAPERIPLFFTADKHLLMSTLEHVTSQMMRKNDVVSLESPNLTVTLPGSPLPPPAPTSPDQRVLQRGDCGQSPQKCAEERLGTLRSVVNALGQLRGKKVLVLLTTRMSSMPGFELSVPGQTPSDPLKALFQPGIVSEYRDLRRLVEEVGRIAAANNVLIYGMEAYESGEQGLAGVTAETGRTSGGRSNANLTRSSKRGEAGTQDLLLTLADETGARSYSGMREAVDMFSQITRDLSFYYSIGYRDSDAKKKEHRVEVRLRNHPDLIVRTRKNIKTETPEDEERGQATAALMSSHPQNALGIRLGGSPMIRRGRTVEIPVHVHIPLSHLTFAEAGDKYRAQFKVLIAAVGDHADFGDSHVEHAQDVVVPHSRWTTAQAQEFRYDTAVRVSPGRYRITVGVTDVNSGESGFQTFTVNAQ